MKRNEKSQAGTKGQIYASSVFGKVVLLNRHKIASFGDWGLPSRKADWQSEQGLFK